MLGVVVHLARTLPLLIAISLVLSGCASSTTHNSSGPVAKDSSTVDTSTTGTSPAALRRYLREWEAAWSRWTVDIAPKTDAEDNAPVYNPTPDASWKPMHRLYGRAATAYRRRERRLAAIPTPLAMRSANDAYMAAVRRQVSRLQNVSDEFAGSDPSALDRALMALGSSQTEFDSDGARWESAVITACKASGVGVPKIVRRKYISNGQRTG
jgi:uncharacterized protein YceK